MVPSLSKPVAAVRGCLRIACALPFALPFVLPFAPPPTLLAAALLATLTVQAQPAAKAARPDPLDPKVSVPALGYVSSFSQYRLLGDEKPSSWRDANDTVTRIGGWRAYAREAQQSDPAASAPAAPAAPAASAAAPAPAAATHDKAKPAPAAHGGHKMP